DDGDIGDERGDEQGGCAVERRGGEAHGGVVAGDVAAEQRAHGDVGDTERAGQQGEADTVVAVIHDLDGMGLSLLGGAAVVVAQALADVADPGGDDTAHAAGADQLVEEDVGDRADQREVAAALADDLVAGGEGNQRLQRQAERYAGAVWHVAG